MPKHSAGHAAPSTYLRETGITVLLNEVEVAEIFGVKPITLRRWRWKNKGPSFVRIGPKSIRYSAEAVKQFVESRSEGGNA